MGLFKSLKDMKSMVEAAPGLIESAQQAGANAQQMAMVGGGQAYVNNVNQAAHGDPSAAALEPIAGVDLDTYARVVKGISVYGYDADRLPEVAASHGIGADDWQAAQAGWGERIQADRALGSRFNQIYTAV